MLIIKRDELRISVQDAINLKNINEEDARISTEVFAIEKPVKFNSESKCLEYDSRRNSKSLSERVAKSLKEFSQSLSSNMESLCESKGNSFDVDAYLSEASIAPRYANIKETINSDDIISMFFVISYAASSAIRYNNSSAANDNVASSSSNVEPSLVPVEGPRLEQRSASISSEGDSKNCCKIS